MSVIDIKTEKNNIPKKEMYHRRIWNKVITERTLHGVWIVQISTLESIHLASLQ